MRTILKPVELTYTGYIHCLQAQRVENTWQKNLGRGTSTCFAGIFVLLFPSILTSLVNLLGFSADRKGAPC